VIEAKNSGISAFEGLSQLLVYAHDCLDRQETVWGLTTNGISFYFVLIHAGNPPTYQLMPLLNFTEPGSAVQILQVLKAIRKLQNSA